MCKHSTIQQQRTDLPLGSFDEYEPQEPTFDDEEPPLSPGSPSTAAQTPAPAHADPDARIQTPGPLNGADADGRQVVEVNGERGAKPAVGGLREKKVANEDRATTPYMTKYERARVLGTRALQIRYVIRTTRGGGR